MPAKRDFNDIERFHEDYIPEPNTGCWLWIGGMTGSAPKYGCVMFNYKSIRAHRYSYILHHGAFDKSLFVCHKCDTPSCVNPEHLFLGTQFDNMRDASKKNRFGDRKGIKCSAAKLSEEQVLAIRSEYIPKKMGFKKLGKKYGVHHVTIQHICTRKTWKHI